MNTSITTIIPFFNSSNSLSVMLDSILSGSVLPSEILLIDDGSTDDSSNIAKNYANKNELIKYIYQPHSGVSAARNLGLENAHGEWISFLDADDYIEPDMYEMMSNSLLEGVSGCICGYFTEKDGISTPYINNCDSILSSPQLLKAMFTNDAVKGFLFNRLFNSAILKDMLFDTNIKLCEDLLFQTTLLCSNSQLSFSVVNKPLYHYVSNSASATNSLDFFENGVFKYAPAYQAIRLLIQEQYIEDSYNSILEHSMYLLLKEYKSGNTSLLSQIRMLQKELKQCHPSNTSKRRLAYLLAPVLYSHFIP